MSVSASNHQLVGTLSRSALFADWPPEFIADVARRLTPRPVAAGTVVCVEGQPGDEMYIVEHGRFLVDAMSGQRRVRLANLGPGAIFGEMAVITGQPRTATITAETDGQLWALGRADLYELIQHNPMLRTNLDWLVSQRISETQQLRLANEHQTVLSLPQLAKPITIGRSNGSDILLDDPRVSRNHAVIHPVGREYEVVDLGSTNGTFVNGGRVTRHLLRDGDEIRIGSTPLLFDRSALTRFSRGGGIQVDAVNLTRVVGKGMTILDDVSLSIYPGEFVCIVGGSGAGKTTLLSALSGLRPPSRGRVLYNGSDFYEHFESFRQSLGYVPQDDIVHVELTVYDTLYYAARLRLPEDTGREEIDRQIDEVLKSMELTERRDTEVRRLSGGQRKRVSIGVELLTKPETFYLDEPTSGLDPGLDKRMMSLLRTLADQGRTVVTTTHATRNVMICDKVIFMARGGLLAFYGSPQDALTYFGVEDFADIYEILEAPGAGQAWRERFRQSPYYERNVTQRLQQNPNQTSSALAVAEPPSPKPRRSGGPSALSQFFWLSVRYLHILRTDRVALGILIAAAPIIGSIVSSTFSHDVFEMTWDAGGDARQAVAMLFMVASGCIFLGSFVASRSIAEEVAVYTRERLVNLKILPYLLSKICALTLFGLIQSALLLAAVVFRIEFPGGTDVILKLYGVLALTTVASVGLGLLLSALTRSGLQATMLLVLVLIPQLSISGSIVPISQIDDVARTLSYVMIGRWSLSLLGYYTDVNERMDAQFPKNDFAEQFDIDPMRCALVLVALFVGCVVIASIALKRRDER